MEKSVFVLLVSKTNVKKDIVNYHFEDINDAYMVACNYILGLFNDFIKKILEAVLKIGIPLVALAIIYSGFLFVFARGNSEKLKTAKNALLYSVIGAVILLGAWALAKVIADTVREL